MPLCNRWPAALVTLYDERAAVMACDIIEQVEG